ncbi:MAG: sigma-70 family RNA polymerase sigma factor [Planctomycetes bacterium]|nr:sigma-70 family RNA polymerase sigma factor [Planctomycetota bacterium]
MSSPPRSGPPPDPGQATSLHVNRAVAGDTASTSWLIERLNPLLLAQAAFRMGPELRRTYDPADLVHEAWLVLLPRLGSLPPRDGRLTPVLLSYLSTTIINKLNNLIRRELRRRLHHGATTDDDPVADLAGPRSEVISAIVHREAQSQVRDLLEELPQQDREILLLRGIEQQPTEDVAAMLELSHEAVYKRYSRALQRLRQRLPDSVFAELSDR